MENRAVVMAGINIPYGAYVTFVLYHCLLQKNYWKLSFISKLKFSVQIVSFSSPGSCVLHAEALLFLD